MSSGTRIPTPYGAALRAGNDESPSLGSNRFQLALEHANLTGNGDLLSGFLTLAEGLNEWDLAYSLPLNAHDTTLGLHYRRSDGEVIERPFDDLDIKSQALTYGIGIRHPVYRSPQAALWVGLRGELRRSRTTLGGHRIALSPGSERGKLRVSVLRFTQDFTWRARWDVVAARSTTSWGLGVLGATTHGGDVPDGRFVSWVHRW